MIYNSIDLHIPDGKIQKWTRYWNSQSNLFLKANVINYITSNIYYEFGKYHWFLISISNNELSIYKTVVAVPDEG